MDCVVTKQIAKISRAIKCVSNVKHDYIPSELLLFLESRILFSGTFYTPKGIVARSFLRVLATPHWNEIMNAADVRLNEETNRVVISRERNPESLEYVSGRRQRSPLRSGVKIETTSADVRTLYSSEGRISVTLALN